MNCKKLILLMIMMFTVSGCVQRNSNENSDIPVGSGIAKDYKPRSANEGAVPVKVNTQNEPETFKLDQNRYNSFEGTIGNNKIRLLLFLDNNNQITGSYYYEKYQKKIQVKGTYNKDSVRLIELDNTTGTERASIAFKIFNDYGDATGEWISRNGDKKYLVKLSLMSTFPGAKNNIYIDAGAQSTEEVEKFAIELKKGILEKNKKSVADKIAYPIDVEVDGKIVEIKNRRAFIDQFDKIFYPDFIEVIRNQCFPLNMDSSYRGIMLGDRGEIWLNYVYHKTISDAQLKVVGINNGKEQ